MSDDSTSSTSCFKPLAPTIASAASSVQPPDEDSESLEQRLLVGVEQLVAPGDRVAQRPLSLRQIGSASFQQRQAAARRCASATGVSTRSRAAASSIASGNPSSWRQMSPAAATSAG